MAKLPDRRTVFPAYNTMSLIDIEFSPPAMRLPKQVADYLEQMETHIEQFRNKAPNRFQGFVPSDYVRFYEAISHVLDRRLACGNLFCEWGSGLGVATCLANMLGFNAYGIEIDEVLVQASQQFAEEHELPNQFIHGSFLPGDADDVVDAAFAENEGCISMYAHADDAYSQLDSEIEDFDLVFAFPWPDDEDLTATIFEKFASNGALLLTYDETDAYRLRRK